jgi:hypothetical protein
VIFETFLATFGECSFPDGNSYHHGSLPSLNYYSHPATI